MDWFRGNPRQPISTGRGLCLRRPHSRSRGSTYNLPVVVGTENEVAVDISKLRAESGVITLDDGYSNTGSCQSAITFIDGEKGILRYRGIPIEQIAEHSTFAETAWLLIYGELPTAEQLQCWSNLLTKHEMLHEGLYKHYDGFPSQGHPMAILSAMINAASCYNPDVIKMESPETFQNAAARLLSKMRTIAAAAYKTSIGQPLIYPKPHLDYCSNFLHMMFSIPFKDYEPDPDIVARAAADPRAARRPRAELLDEHRADGGVERRQPVRELRGRRLRPVGPAARRRERGGDRDAAVHPRQRHLGEGLRREGQGQDVAHQADGLRPPGLQELRPARQDHQAGGRPGPEQAEDPRPDARPRARRSKRPRSPTTTSRRRSSTRTSTSTPASSCGPSASR